MIDLQNSAQLFLLTFAFLLFGAGGFFSNYVWERKDESDSYMWITVIWALIYVIIACFSVIGLVETIVSKAF